jgi:hypothetical protein
LLAEVTTSVPECHVNGTYVRGGGEVKRRILIGQSIPPTPSGMPFGRLKLSPLLCARIVKTQI